MATTLDFFYRWREALELLGQEEVVIRQKKKRVRLKLNQFIVFQGKEYQLIEEIEGLPINEESLRREVTRYHIVKSTPFGPIVGWFWRQFTDIEIKEKILAHYENYDDLESAVRQEAINNDNDDYKIEDIEENFKTANLSIQATISIPEFQNNNNAIESGSKKTVQVVSISQLSSTIDAKVSKKNSVKEDFSEKIQEKFSRWADKYYKKEWLLVEGVYKFSDPKKINWEFRQKMLQREQHFQNLMNQWVMKFPEDRQGEAKNLLWSQFFKRDEEFQQLADPFGFYEIQFRRWARCYKEDLKNFIELDHENLSGENLYKVLKKMTSLRKETFEQNLEKWSKHVIKERSREFQEYFKALYDAEENNFQKKIENTLYMQPLSSISHLAHCCLLWYEGKKSDFKLRSTFKRSIQPSSNNHSNFREKSTYHQTGMTLQAVSERSLVISSNSLENKRSEYENSREIDLKDLQEFEQITSDKSEEALAFIEKLGKGMIASLDRFVDKALLAAKAMLEEKLYDNLVIEDLLASDQQLERKCKTFLIITHPDKMSRFNTGKLTQKATEIFKDLREKKEKRSLEIKKYQDHPLDLVGYDPERKKNLTLDDFTPKKILHRILEISDKKLELLIRREEKMRAEIAANEQEIAVYKEEIAANKRQIEELKSSFIEELKSDFFGLRKKMSRLKELLREFHNQGFNVKKEILDMIQTPERDNSNMDLTDIIAALKQNDKEITQIKAEADRIQELFLKQRQAQESAQEHPNPIDESSLSTSP